VVAESGGRESSSRVGERALRRGSGGGAPGREGARKEKEKGRDAREGTALGQTQGKENKVPEWYRANRVQQIRYQDDTVHHHPR